MTLDLENQLNPSQLEAVTFANGPLLVLAGAGSGKTRALTYRAANLIVNHNIPQDGILLLTFTNKAAGEMQQRLQNLISHTLPFAGTFHSFSAKILRKYAHLLGYGHNFVIYDDQDQLDLVKQISKNLGLTPKEFRPRSLLTQISNAKNELITPQDYYSIANGYFQETVADVYRNYQQHLKDANALDFDDLLLKTLELLQTQPQVLESLQQKFQYVLVDEYQDTNKAQYLIAKLLAAKHKNINAVGDASQSIYRWRGADYRNLEYLQKDFPDITTIKLEQNYRSTQTILDAATNVIQKNTSHPVLALWTEQGTGDPITLFEAADQTDEAAYITNRLRLTPEDTKSAILYRTNAQSRALEEALIRAGIPYQLVGGTKFYQRKEIKDILAYLRLVINRGDLVSFERAQKNGKRRLQKLLAFLDKKDLTNTAPIEIFDQVLEASTYLDKYDKNIEEDQNRLDNIKELRSVSSQFDTLTEFLENVALVEDNTLKKEAQNQKEAARTTLMTIHSAKGLEFDQVFVVGLEEGLFPHSRSLLEPAELEEERRLCYVALTRAKKTLYLTYAKNRVYYGGGGAGIVSRFVGEIPGHLLKSTSPYGNQTFRPKVISTDQDELLDRFLDDEVDIDELLR